MQHAFDQPAARIVPATSLSGGERLLIVLCIPPILLAAWAGSIHHNWERGLSAVRWAAGGDKAPPPLLMAGSASGLILVLGVTLTGGLQTTAATLCSPWIWILVLLPEIAWLVPLSLALVVLPLRRPLQRAARSAQVRSGAFEQW